ncbi:DEAD/DEAH box helicase family protein [Streptomyces microflavus]
MTVVAATTAPGRPGKRARVPAGAASAASRDAGLFVAATGTGKTLVSIRVADELRARLVLFVVPSTWPLRVRWPGGATAITVVSSMDAQAATLVAARVMSSTDPVALAGLMSVVGERRTRSGP